jgi:hypothetical protein
MNTDKNKKSVSIRVAAKRHPCSSVLRLVFSTLPVFQADGTKKGASPQAAPCLFCVTVSACGENQQQRGWTRIGTDEHG